MDHWTTLNFCIFLMVSEKENDVTHVREVLSPMGCARGIIFKFNQDPNNRKTKEQSQSMLALSHLQYIVGNIEKYVLYVKFSPIFKLHMIQLQRQN